MYRCIIYILIHSSYLIPHYRPQGSPTTSAQRLHVRQAPRGAEAAGDGQVRMDPHQLLSHLMPWDSPGQRGKSWLKKTKTPTTLCMNYIYSLINLDYEIYIYIILYIYICVYLSICLPI
jgi:hypothetical protein